MRLSACFELAYERVGPPASFSTSTSASRRMLSSGYTKFTRPQSSAFCPGMRIEAGLQVGPAAEPAPGAGDQNSANAPVSRGPFHDFAQRRAELGDPSVERLRSVERDPADGSGLLPQDGV